MKTEKIKVSFLILCYYLIVSLVPVENGRWEFYFTSPTVHAENRLNELVTGNTRFAFDLYHMLREDGGNQFFSPYSISTALAMAYAGSRGATSEEIKNALHFPLNEKLLHPVFKELSGKLTGNDTFGRKTYASGFKLRIANKMWGQKDHTFLDDYCTTITDNYGTEPEFLDFASNAEKSRLIINDWVSAQTERMIQNIIPPKTLSSDTKLVLTNAVYFEAKWVHTFITAATHEEDFFLIDGGIARVPMMVQKRKFRYCEDTLYQALEKDYRADMSMILFLPRSGSFQDFEQSMSPERLGSVIDSFQEEEVILKLPKFDYESPTIQLIPLLSRLGMEEPFTLKANFSGIDGTKDLFISDILHQAKVMVNEEGTVAAAATIVAMVAGLPVKPPKPPVEFTVNRPYIFVIRDKRTGTLLFIGRILNPSDEGEL